MHTGCILIKNPGEVLPSGLLGPAIAQNGSFIGAVICKDGKFDIKGTSAEKPDDYLKMIEQLQTEHHADKVWFYLGKNETGFSDESQQPFFIIADETSEEVLCFLDGSFEPFGEPKSVHSNEFFFAQKQMAPHLNSLMKLCGGDCKKLFEYLKDPVQSKTYLNQVGSRAVMVLVNRFGENLIWEKGQPGNQSFKWGYASKMYGYVDPEAAPAQEPAPTAMPTRRRAIDPEAKVPEATPSSGKSTVRERFVAHPPDVKAEKVTIERMEQPPKEMWGKHQQVKGWYRMFIPKSKGLPDGWDSKTNPPAIMVKITVDKAAHDAMMASTAVKAPEDKPVEQPATPAATPPQDTPAAVEAKTPLIPATMVKTIQEKFLKDPTVAKVLDDNGVQMLSPKELQAIERKHPTFAQALGLPGLESTFRWSFEDRVKLCTQWPRAAAVLMQDYLFAYVDVLAEADGTEGTVENPAPAPKIETPKPAAAAAGAMPARRRAV